MADKVKHEIKKYLKRERRKQLPEGAKYWGFDCKFGETEAAALEVHLSLIGKKIDEIVDSNKTSFYVQILAKAISTGEKPFDEED